MIGSSDDVVVVVFRCGSSASWCSGSFMRANSLSPFPLDLYDKLRMKRLALKSGAINGPQATVTPIAGSKKLHSSGSQAVYVTSSYETFGSVITRRSAKAIVLCKISTECAVKEIHTRLQAQILQKAQLCCLLRHANSKLWVQVGRKAQYRTISR
jgi:hypothetical protein